MGLDNPLHIAVLALLLLLVFGARRLPELGRSLGSGIKEFKGSLEPGRDAPAQPLEKPAPAGELH
jgi:sec-independent protein translocase protein TatA